MNLHTIVPEASPIASLMGQSPYISSTTIENAADWHATMALKAYRKRQYKEYTRHIRIADQLRAAA